VTVSATVLVLPAVSVARAVRVCVPFANAVVDHVHVHDVVPVTDPHVPPSTCTATDATAVLSELLPLTVALPATVEPFVGAANATDGGVVSPQFLHGLPACAVAGASRPMQIAAAVSAPSGAVRLARLIIAGAAFGRRW